MRIGVCISGHFRRFQDVYQNYLDYFLKPLQELGQVDVFIDTWTELNNSNSFSTQQKDSLNDSNKLDICLIKKMYNPISLCVENFDHVKSYFLIDDFYSPEQIPFVHKLSYNKDTRIQYCIPMFYKWYQCNKQKKRYEQSQGFKYDIVIKMRLDLFFYFPFKLDPQIDLSCIWSRALATDFLFYSSSENMDKLVDIYIKLPDLIKRYECDYLPEQLLEYHLQEEGFDHSRRKFFPEYALWLYPRRHFIQASYNILAQYGMQNQFKEVMTKYGPHLNLEALKALE